MGLSKPSDEMIFDIPTISNLYSYRKYLNPKYGAWEPWYSWYPIWMNKWVLFPSYSKYKKYIKVRKLCWLNYIVRRPVVDQFKTHWEYTTTEDLLRFS